MTQHLCILLSAETSRLIIALKTCDFANALTVKHKQIPQLLFSPNIVSVFDRKRVLQYQQEGLKVDNKETLAKINELADRLIKQSLLLRLATH